MRYLLLCRFNEGDWNALPEAERDAIMERYHEVIDELASEGVHVGTGKLEPAASGRTVRRDPDAAAGPAAPVTDGPFLETKEHVGGYHVVEAASMDEATAIAARIPTVAYGGVIEVRPLAFER